jgi:hypothetical protein
MTDQQVLLQLKNLPDNLKREVVDFIGYLFSKYNLATKKRALPASNSKPAFGCGAVKMKIAPDFDAPLDDFKEYME